MRSYQVSVCEDLNPVTLEGRCPSVGDIAQIFFFPSCLELPVLVAMRDFSSLTKDQTHSHCWTTREVLTLCRFCWNSWFYFECGMHSSNDINQVTWTLNKGSHCFLFLSSDFMKCDALVGKNTWGLDNERPYAESASLAHIFYRCWKRCCQMVF